MIEVKLASDEDRELLIRFLGGYLHGGCFIFALTLHRYLNLPLVCILDGKKIIHAAVRVDEDTFRDARGDTTRDEFVKEFNAHHCEIRSTSESELKDISRKVNKEELSDELVEACRRNAESAWPEWQWKNSNLDRLQAFTSELEELSRKHGFWIREAFPAIAPIIYPWCGDEKGYLLEQLPSIDGQFYLKRIL